MPKVTVIVPVYNAEKTIEKCIDSLLKQSLDNIEILLINDGSSDRSLSLCKKISDGNLNVKVFSMPNGGPSKARNLGLLKANADYIGFVDADDYVDIGMYEKLYKIANNEIDIVCCSFCVHDDSDNKTYKYTKMPFLTCLGKDELRKIVIRRYYEGDMEGLPSLCNKIYKRSFLVERGLRIDKDRVRAEDYWFNLEAFQLANSIIFVKDAFYHYLQTNELSVMKSYRENQFDLFLKTRLNLHKLNNEKFHFTLKNDYLDRTFFVDVNEYIFQIFRFEEFPKIKVMGILMNSEFCDAVSASTSVQFHLKVIKTCIEKKLYLVTFNLYRLWYVLRVKK